MEKKNKERTLIHACQNTRVLLRDTSKECDYFFIFQKTSMKQFLKTVDI